MGRFRTPRSVELFDGLVRIRRSSRILPRAILTVRAGAGFHLCPRGMARRNAMPQVRNRIVKDQPLCLAAARAAGQPEHRPMPPASILGHRGEQISAGEGSES